jgi:polysaccharide biosynthesis/export protein
MRPVILLLFVLGIPILSAQDLMKMGSLQDLESKVAKKSALQMPEAPDIEGPVDENIYRVGPGDLFSIVFGSRLEEEQQVMVTPEGLLVLPAAGNVEVAGLLLREAKEIIKKALASKFLSTDVTISLIQLRTFRVTVSGSVNFPGLVSVNAMNRVSDAILLAGGVIVPINLEPEVEDPRKQVPGTRKPKTEEKLTEEEQKKLEQQTASQRNITVTRRDGSILGADLLMYESAGVLDANPFLLDGDVVMVEPLQKEVGEVAIYGAVKTPGLFEFVPGDRVIDLVRLGRGFRLDADSSKIELTRFQLDGRTVKQQAFSIDWSDPASVSSVLEMRLNPDDRLFVRSIPNFHRKRTVEIRGEVKYPGEYPLLKSPTYLTELVEMAGGFTNQAMLNGAYVQRRAMEEVKDREFERLDLLISTDMGNTEKAYHRERARELKGLVSVDFTRLFTQGKKELDVVLQDQDLIVVPAVENTVYVVGHVKSPGLLNYEAGKSASYYIQKAGGLNSGAWKRKIKIKKAGTGELLSLSKTTVEMGDMIFVPEKVEREFWETFRDVAVVTTQLATMVMVITQINYWTSLRK